MIDYQGSAFTATQVLRFMETQGRQLPKCAKGFISIGPEKAVCGVLDYGNTITRGYSQDGIHFAAYAGIMNNYNRLGPVGNRGFELSFIKIERTRADIDKNGSSSSEHKGIG